jgi:hypothetical protein
VRHLIERCRTEVVGGNQRKDRGSGIGGAVHVADVNFVERGFADTEHQRTFFFEADIGGALDEVGRNAVGDASQRADAARQDDHRVGRVGAAGNVGADIGVGLLLNFAGGAAPEELSDEVVAAAEAKLFSHDAQRAVGGNEVDGFSALIAVHSEHELTEKDCAAGAGGRDGQVLRRGGQIVAAAFNRRLKPLVDLVICGTAKPCPPGN